MDEQLRTILEIAEYLGLTNIANQINDIILRGQQENACLILPLVGEFSSGKTTLLNALTDSKQLETATKPTTATIYELHFGCERCHAQILKNNGKTEKVEDLSLLKNDELTDTKVVTVFDTSKRVPATTILVDTPGLSSPEPEHKQTLVDFLPKADGILLVVDINQQITRSLTDFIETMKLSKKPIYLILTKGDTKAASEIESAKHYIGENCKIPLQQIAVVSAAKDELGSLYALLNEIQKDKDRILKEVDGMRVKNIITKLTQYIEELMNASSSDKDLEKAIQHSQYELEKIKRSIDRLADSIADSLDEAQRTVARKFEDITSSKLNALINGKSCNFDKDAISIINTTASLLMNDYKTQLRSLLAEKAKSNKGTDNEISWHSLEELDLSSFDISGLSYNLSLNTMGHEYDTWIKRGVIAVAAVGTVAAVASTGGAAAGVGALGSIDTIADVADTVTDVGSIISNNRTVDKINKAVGFAAQTAGKYVELDEKNNQAIQDDGSSKGMVDSMVGLVTDKLMSKPQRSRAVRVYVDGTLAPEFKAQITSISQRLTDSIRCSLRNDASALLGQKTESLNQLKNEMKEKKELFELRMEQLRAYKTKLLTL